MNDQDVILLKKISTGDRLSFDFLFRKYYAVLTRFAYSFLCSKDSSEEVVQEFFIYIWQHAATININTSFKAYCYTSVRNRSLNHIKSNVIRINYESQYTDKILQDSENEVDFRKDPFQRNYNSALNTLPEKCREIFILAKHEGLTYEEIADYLSISVKTIENQMGIALKKLREYLTPFLKED